MHEQLFQDMAQSIIDGDAELAEQLAKQAVELGIDPLEAINKGFVIGVNHVGSEFSCGNAFLPELVMAGEAMKTAVSTLEPEMARRGTARQVSAKWSWAPSRATSMRSARPWWARCSPPPASRSTTWAWMCRWTSWSRKAREVDADIIGVSALLTTTMVRQRDVVEALDDMGLRPQVKVMVGGAPVTGEWVKEIGADGYSEDAIGAVQVAKQLVGQTRKRGLMARPIKSITNPQAQPEHPYARRKSANPPATLEVIESVGVRFPSQTRPGHLGMPTAPPSIGRPRSSRPRVA